MNPPRHPCSRCGSDTPNPSCYVCWEGDETPEPLEDLDDDPTPPTPDPDIP